jgi:tRNA G18 (ribose-2'-O)-methylase SpoU
MKSGYFGIGVYNLQKEVNLGTLWRSAYCLGASYIFIVGGKYSHQSSDTVKSWQHIPLFKYKDFTDFQSSRPHNCQLVGVELTPVAKSIKRFLHPLNACYILGPENGSLGESVLQYCQHIIQIPTKQCLNVSAAAAIVAYDRTSKL